MSAAKSVATEGDRQKALEAAISTSLVAADCQLRVPSPYVVFEAVPEEPSYTTQFTIRFDPVSGPQLFFGSMNGDLFSPDYANYVCALVDKEMADFPREDAAAWAVECIASTRRNIHAGLAHVALV